MMFCFFFKTTPFSRVKGVLKRTQQQTAENQQNNQSILYRIPERMSINLSVNQMLILSIPITIPHVVYQLDSWQLEGFLNEEKPAYQKVFILPAPRKAPYQPAGRFPVRVCLYLQRGAQHSDGGIRQPCYI